jgi:hypothetical protein
VEKEGVWIWIGAKGVLMFWADGENLKPEMIPPSFPRNKPDLFRPLSHSFTHSSAAPLLFSSQFSLTCLSDCHGVVVVVSTVTFHHRKIPPNGLHCRLSVLPLPSSLTNNSPLPVPLLPSNGLFAAAHNYPKPLYTSSFVLNKYECSLLLLHNNKIIIINSKR